MVAGRSGQSGAQRVRSVVPASPEDSEYAITQYQPIMVQTALGTQANRSTVLRRYAQVYRFLHHAY